MKILIVSEEPSFRLLAHNYLVDEGNTVSVAPNGREGYKKVSTEKFDLVITDLYMPIVDGLQLCKNARELPDRSNTPFIFVSTRDEEGDLAIMASYKHTAFFRKGRSLSELSAAIHNLTSQKQADERATAAAEVQKETQQPISTVGPEVSGKDKSSADQAHILLVDDDDALRLVLGDLLSAEGFQITSASDGQEAIDLLQKGTYDLVLLDIIMPNVSGFGVLKYIKENSVPTKVIMLTAYSELKLAVESKEYGARDFIAKPFMRNDLLNTIRKVLKE